VQAEHVKTPEELAEPLAQLRLLFGTATQVLFDKKYPLLHEAIVVPFV
jgi:hypothetical protein